ncbi:MAG: hypothetical protein RMI93_00050 [Caldimicrobium sp.]|nr:hypothetical protein [Caldimicrobium sp.]MDW8181988.1 hypothetical protein [Caldimicrobium sp.]
MSKGLTAVAVLLSFVFIDTILNRRFFHFNLKILICFITGLFLYFLPYYFTSKELGTDLPFHLWVRENLKQITDPYDNIRPFYIYLYFWPLWIAPFSIFLIGALVYTIRNYKTLEKEGKLFFITNLVILVIFTMAKARRGYYILPIIPFSILLIVFYIMKVPQNLPKRIYQKLLLISPLLTLTIPLFLSFFGLKVKGEIILPMVLFGTFQILILIKYLKGFDFYFSMILISLTLQTLFFGFIQPNYSFSTEKEAGLFLKKLTTDQSEKAICTLQKEFQPVANFYFYAGIREKLPEIDPTEKAIENCQIVVLRKNLPLELERQVKSIGFQIKSFESKGDKSKTYFIIYNSSTLKTPSL